MWRMRKGGVTVLPPLRIWRSTVLGYIKLSSGRERRVFVKIALNSLLVVFWYSLVLWFRFFCINVKNIRGNLDV